MNPDTDYGLALSQGSVNGGDYNDKTKHKHLIHADTRHNARLEREAQAATDGRLTQLTFTSHGAGGWRSKVRAAFPCPHVVGRGGASPRASPHRGSNPTVGPHPQDLSKPNPFPRAPPPALAQWGGASTRHTGGAGLGPHTG